MDNNGKQIDNKPSRRYANDWLTVLAMVMVFLFHCARYFDAEGWHVKNPEQSQAMSLFTGFTAQWIMPLFFILSGISSCYSLQSRSTAAYLTNRIKRLLIPLIFGVFIFLAPIQVWIERASHGQFTGGLLAFYPRYFDGFYGFGGNFAWMGLHLWYLEVLFIFTLLTLPVFLLFKTSQIPKVAASYGSNPFNPAGLLFLSLPIIASECLVNLDPQGVGMRAFGGWSVVTYLVFFLTGFFLARHPESVLGIIESRFHALLLGLITACILFVTPVDLTPLGETAKYYITVITRALNSWFWLVAVLGFGFRYLNFSNHISVYTREAVLPFYILHQTLIVMIGYYIIDWRITVPLKYLLLGSLSFISIAILYHYVIRKNRLLRFLFGM